MLILAVDTATDQVGCAVAGHEGVLASLQATRGRRHAEALAPAVRVVTAEAGVALTEISAVAVDVGPGLFTGLRVGFATATTIAYALDVPMIGIGSLDLLAHPARLTSRLVAAVIDARRGEVFSALYRPVPGGMQRIAASRVGPPSELVAELRARGDECLAVGEGARRYAEELSGVDRLVVGDPELDHPSARVLARLAHARALREEFVAPGELRPVYLREPDARIGWEERGAPVGGTP